MKTVVRYLGKTWIPAIAALVMLLLATSPPAFGGSGGSLTVASSETVGTVVVVTVSNTTSEPKTATVRVVAQVDGNLVVSYAPVSVAPNSSANAVAGFPAEVGGVIRVGIINENSTPF
jgi:hypothetical protein